MGAYFWSRTFAGPTKGSSLQHPSTRAPCRALAGSARFASHAPPPASPRARTCAHAHTPVVLTHAWAGPNTVSRAAATCQRRGAHPFEIPRAAAGCMYHAAMPRCCAGTAAGSLLYRVRQVVVAQPEPLGTRGGGPGRRLVVVPAALNGCSARQRHPLATPPHGLSCVRACVRAAYTRHRMREACLHVCLPRPPSHPIPVR